MSEPTVPVSSYGTEPDERVEALSRRFHAVYQAEAKRQYSADLDDVRHPDAYDDLDEHTKDYDRALARDVLRFLDLLEAGLSNKTGIPIEIDHLIRAWATAPYTP